MTLSDILLPELRSKFPHATFAIEVVNVETKQCKLLVNGVALEQLCCDIDAPATLGTDGKPVYRKATQLIIALAMQAVTAQLSKP